MVLKILILVVLINFRFFSNTNESIKKSGFEIVLSVEDSRISEEMYFNMTIFNNTNDSMIYLLTENFFFKDSIIHQFCSNWDNAASQEFYPIGGIWNHTCTIDSLITIAPKGKLRLQWESGFSKDFSKANKKFSLIIPILKKKYLQNIYKTSNSQIYCNIISAFSQNSSIFKYRQGKKNKFEFTLKYKDYWSQ